MNMQILSFPLLFLSLLYLMMWRKSRKVNGKPLTLAPGPWKLPFIGNLHQLVGHAPHQRFAELAKQYGPVMNFQLGEVSTIIISSPETAKEVMKTQDIVFSRRPFLLVGDVVFYKSTDLIYGSCSDRWRQMKRICASELLSSKRVESFRPIREQEISNLITSISSSSGFTVNLSKMLFSVTCTMVARAVFGKICEDQETFISYAREVIAMISGLNVADLFPSCKFLHKIPGIHTELEKLHEKVDSVLEAMIDEHRISRAKIGNKGGGDDLVHAMLNVQEQGNLELSLTTDNIKAVILDMFLGGIETSATIIEWAISEILRHPKVMQKAQAEVRQVLNRHKKVEETGMDELKYLKLIIKETMRMHPPGPLLAPRESSEHCKIHGYDIPAKSRVLVNAYAIGRDPNHWAEAEKFIPERFLDSGLDYNSGGNFGYLPFGAGRRTCPGSIYGMANVEFPLAQLLYHFDWKLSNGKKNEDLDMTQDFATVARRKNDLCLIPTPYEKVSRE